MFEMQISALHGYHSLPTGLRGGECFKRRSLPASVYPQSCAVANVLMNYLAHFMDHGCGLSSTGLQIGVHDDNHMNYLGAGRLDRD